MTSNEGPVYPDSPPSGDQVPGETMRTVVPPASAVSPPATLCAVSSESTVTTTSSP
ncbi:hypothetical protein D3C74_408720 [compost metagenome]